LTKVDFYFVALRAGLIGSFIAFGLLAPRGSALSWSLVIALALYSRTCDFERIEHIASHSGGGRILKRTAPLRWRLIEGMRRYFVWPLFGWAANYYYVTHTFHHHVENDSPSDWQSLQRFDRTSFFDFTKAVAWFGLNVAFPFDTTWYLIQRRRTGELMLLLRGQVALYVMLALIAVVRPELAVVLIVCMTTRGLGFYIFTLPWHGLHPTGKMHDVIASNNNPWHLAHHRKPGIHIGDVPALDNVVSKLPPGARPVLFRREQMSASDIWRLQARLWRKDYAGVAAMLVELDEWVTEPLTEGVSAVERVQMLRRRSGQSKVLPVHEDALSDLAASAFGPQSNAGVRQLDGKVSEVLGAYVERRIRSAAEVRPSLSALPEGSHLTDAVTLRASCRFRADPGARRGCPLPS